ncbi:hypothetical protein BD779DRAFT_1547181 [Infundibulicybe gibba]|nr:hypothetical protein BD779DRAFT_1547181 [Infundibulicybe gibba]
MLQDITIIVEDDAQVASSTPFATAFELCPQLHRFEYATIGRCHVENLAIANFNVPWHQLTTLRLCSPSILAHKCLDILPQCTSLQECSIDISPIDDLTLQTIVGRSNCPTVLPYLHTLCINIPPSPPSKIQTNGPTYLVPWSLSAVQLVLSDTIKELDLSGFDFPENLPETLALVPNLETLQLPSDPSQDFDSLFDTIEARIEAARIDRGIAAFVRVVVLNRGNSPLDEARLVALTKAGYKFGLNEPRTTPSTIPLPH